GTGGDQEVGAGAGDQRAGAVLVKTSDRRIGPGERHLDNIATAREKERTPPEGQEIGTSLKIAHVIAVPGVEHRSSLVVGDSEKRAIRVERERTNGVAEYAFLLEYPGEIALAGPVPHRLSGLHINDAKDLQHARRYEVLSI